MPDPTHQSRGRHSRRRSVASGGRPGARFLLGVLEFVPRSLLPTQDALTQLAEQAERAGALDGIVRALHETRTAARSGQPRRRVEDVLPEPARSTLGTVLDALYQQASPGSTGGPVSFDREELLRRLARAVKGRQIAYAIGGATAMAAHGYERQTRDVDVFTTDLSIHELLRALKMAGLDIYPVMEPSHYVARLPGDPEFERRIDVLVTWSEPELSGVEHAQPVGPHGLNVFSANLLALSKFYAWDESGADRHAQDLLSMRARGLFDLDVAREMLTSVDPERLSAWDKLFRAPGASPDKLPPVRIRMPGKPATGSSRKRSRPKPAAKKRKPGKKRPPSR